MSLFLPPDTWHPRAQIFGGRFRTLERHSSPPVYCQYCYQSANCFKDLAHGHSGQTSIARG